MITPWYQTSLAGRYYTANNSAVTTAIMPGSFAFLKCLAKSIKTFPNWLAIAGVTRGFVPELISLHVNDVLTNAIADSYQDHNALNINAITNIKPYGYCIWGNRTLKNNVNIGGTTATSFLNIRNMLSDIKK